MCIRGAKRTLEHVVPKFSTMDFHEFDAVCHKVSNILNSRPLAARMLGEDSFHSITPNDFLLGRAARSTRHTGDPDLGEEDEEVVKTLEYSQEIASAWWSEWMKRCFPGMVPRKKWKQSHGNLSVGDVCLLKYSSKFATPTFCLCRVKAVAPDQGGLVRTCEVALRPRRAGESGSREYQHKEPTILTVGVQRLAVLLPMEGQEACIEGEAGSQRNKEAEAGPGQEAAGNQVEEGTGDAGPGQEPAGDPGQVDEKAGASGPVQEAARGQETRARKEPCPGTPLDTGTSSRPRRSCRKK